MRLGAVGTLVWDRIWHPAGVGPVEQWGGAVYSLAALAAAAPPEWQVVPIVKVGEDLAASALTWLRGLPGVVPGEGVRVVPEPNNRVELRYHDPAHRSELLTGGVPPWTWEELEPLVATLDALYVNFLSGLEMDLPTAERLRRGFAGPIYADLHSLFLGPPGRGPRAPRPLPDRERWLACFDAVQLNESELALLAGGGDGDPAWLMDHGPSLALVTLGGRGARFATRGEPGAGVARGVVEAPDGELPGDPTGCGDVWGSVLWTGVLAGLPLRDALTRAHRATAGKIRHPATDALHLRLRDVLRTEPLPGRPSSP